jgi:uncharacterized membrane protein
MSTVCPNRPPPPLPPPPGDVVAVASRPTAAADVGCRCPAPGYGVVMAVKQATPDLPTGSLDRSTSTHARTRLAVAAVVGVVVAGIVVAVGGAVEAPMLGWDVAAVVYLVWTWISVWPLDEEHTARYATFEEPGRKTTDIILLVASVVSLIAVTVVLVSVGKISGALEGALVVTAVASVVLSWAVVHTVFMLRYARLYFTGPDGGVDFNQDGPPRYSDFAYLAFTIGMTFQVSDTELQTTAIRATALRHALLSYLFGAVILATTINLIAGLSK